MKDDFLKELEHLGLIARLKRLSDSMLQSIRDLYKLKGIDIEPNWHFVFLLLKKNKRSTMTEMAESFQLSQPAVVKIINKMKQKGYIDIVEDNSDNRKRQLQLSQKAIDQLPLFESIWSAGQQSIKEMLDEDEAFLDLLEKMEQHIRNKNFKDRVLSHLS
ncbi:MarR family transcriptional regulator [Fulvivirgaceae bacterium BMA10]|uniref:MarR family transcriptional regulator n=1 Tax=Splendidivirga corallicola TaxID=3051826 RepID=A0ABT8KZC3_9BACT|nr:MarR family transcriptional regulator [Fulvivirgaceae bacterium BMA10]